MNPIYFEVADTQAFAVFWFKPSKLCDLFISEPVTVVDMFYLRYLQLDSFQNFSSLPLTVVRLLQ